MHSPLTPDAFKESHGYDMSEGVWYPRVTKIVDIKSKPALYRFYARMGDFAASERMKDRSAKEGTAMHEAAENILLGKVEAFPLLIKPSVDAFFEFISKTPIKAEPAFVERRLRNDEHRYAGTLDAVAEIGGKVGILDIKTSQDIYRDYCLQTAAYFYAVKKDVPELETRWILRIDQSQPCVHCGALLRSKGGRPTVKTKPGNAFMKACKHEWGPMRGFVELREFPSPESDFEAFLGAKRLWEWEHEEILKQIGYLS